MANFNPPFSNLADKRYPTSDERQNGFPCGPADQQLFNGLFHRLEAELGAVITQAGIVQADGSFTQVRDAIQNMIASAIGALPPDAAPDTSGYLLMSQAQARLPIFPEVQTADNKIVVTSPSAGTVRLPAGVTFLHRGIFPITTAQTDFPTLGGKIYHLRWSLGGGFELKDLADVAYNPSALPENSPVFDSTYDNMLIARVITNGANVATITNLVNEARMMAEGVNEGAMTTARRWRQASRVAQINYNFSRTPILAIHEHAVATDPDYTRTGWFYGGFRYFHDMHMQVQTKDRYGASVLLIRDWGLDFSVAYQAVAV